MPPLPAAAKVLKGVWVQTLDTQEMVNLFHILYTGAGANQTDLDALAADWANALKTFVPSLQEVDVLNNRLDVIDLTSETALTTSVPVTGTGTHSGGLMGANTACCISWHIHRRYRGGHPRTYIGGLPISALNSEREFTVTYTNLCSTAGATYLAAVPGLTSGAYGGLTPVNLSYFTGKMRRDVPVTDELLFPVTNSRIDSQRRRSGKK